MVMDRSWLLTDWESGLYVESLSLSSAELGIPDSRVEKRCLRGGLSDGVDLIEVAAGELSCTVLPTRGMGLWRASYGDVPLGWQSPVRGPVHPAFVNQAARGGMGWLRGFDEWMARCGLESHGAPEEDGDTPLSLHGHIANLPAQRVAVAADPSAGTVTITGTVHETALFHPKLLLETAVTLGLDSSRITIRDKVTNLGDVPTEMELLYHTNYGLPFLGEGSRFLIPFEELTPYHERSAEGLDTYDVYEPPTPGFVEQVYLFSPAARSGDTASLAAITNPQQSGAAVMRFDIRQLPHVAQWKSTGGASDGYVTGLEPGTSFPNPRSVEREAGRVVTLAVGASYDVTLMHEVAVGGEAVDAVAAEVAEIQSGAAGTVNSLP